MSDELRDRVREAFCRNCVHDPDGNNVGDCGGCFIKEQIPEATFAASRKLLAGEALSEEEIWKRFRRNCYPSMYGSCERCQQHTSCIHEVRGALWIQRRLLGPDEPCREVSGTKEYDRRCIACGKPIYTLGAEEICRCVDVPVPDYVKKPAPDAGEGE